MCAGLRSLLISLSRTVRKEAIYLILEAFLLQRPCGLYCYSHATFRTTLQRELEEPGACKSTDQGHKDKRNYLRAEHKAKRHSVYHSVPRNNISI